MFLEALTFFALSGGSLGQFIDNGLPSGSSFGLAGQNASYDYVIIGGGTAGNVLAYRLANDRRFSVAVIEAGSFYELDSGNRSVIPGYSTSTTPLIDWGFHTTPQDTLQNEIQPYPRGKCLGGSSARNAMVYQRPTIGAMQQWADEVGDQSWTFENTLKYYQRSTSFTPPTPGIRLANSSTGDYNSSVFGEGPLQVGYTNYVCPISSWQVLALSEAGDPLARDGFESGSLLGHYYAKVTIDSNTQERSTSQTYLDLALQRTQLTVYTHTMAKKILISANRTATGVEVETDGIPFRIDAAREVIVSTGAVQSPQLLMVSGIGPANTLNILSIPVIQDLPGVGQNMQDNPLFGISFAVDTETASTVTNDPARFAGAVAEYNENRTGLLTTASGDFISFEKLVDLPSLNISSQAMQDMEDLPADWPDVQIWGYPSYFGFNLTTPPPDSQNYASFIASLTAPLSRGNITITSSNTSDPPFINPQWLAHPTDQELAVAAMRRMRQIFNTTILQQIAPYGEAFPGANITSYEGLLSVVRGQTGTFYHGSATCKMGREGDGMAVVDSRARVFGVERLRVVDASAFPFLPPGQPQATVYMFAEKIAEDILHLSGNVTRARR